MHRLLGVVLLLATVIGVAPSRAATSGAGCAGVPQVSASADPSFGAMFDAYGNDGTRTDDWTGSDGMYSIPVSKGRVVWDASDTFLGEVNADGSRAKGSQIIHNDLLLQHGSALVATVHGGTPSAPASLVSPSDASWYWMGDGTREGRWIRVLVPKFARTGPGAWDWSWAGTDVASFPVDGGRPSITPAPAGGVMYGAAILNDGGYTYVYGVEDLAADNYLHVARVPRGGLLGPWEFFTGAGWSSDPSASARLIDHVDTGLGVARVGSSYELVTFDTSRAFSGRIVVSQACSPWGPFGTPVTAYTAPENGAVDFTYSAHVHPEFTSTAGLLVSYDVNAWRAGDLYGDVENYRPRFIRLRIGTPPPAR